MFANYCSPKLADCFNTSVNNCKFPDELKWADITPVHKKDSKLDKDMYRPISILPTVSKVFERIIFDQLTVFFKTLLSPLLCGFRNGFNTQHSLTRLLQKWQSCLDRKGVVGTVLMDLSKAYDCIQHDLLIAKLAAYGLSHKSLRFLHNYLSNRKQRVKLGALFSSWLEVIFGVPQGSILGPLLFNIFLNDIFLFILEAEICNFADDNTIYACEDSFDNVAIRLNNDIKRVIEWFKVNSLVANPGKFQIMFLGLTDIIPIAMNISGKFITVQDEVTLLGIIIDKQLNFSAHIKKLCKNANNKTSVLVRHRSYMSLSQATTIFNAYIFSQFFYCPLVWMFCRKTEMTLINKAHKRSLRAVYDDYSLDMSELLELNGGISIHTKHLQTLMLEVYKSLHHQNPELMWGLFNLKNISYNLRGKLLLRLPTARTVTYGTNSLIFKASILWNCLPNKFKSSESVSLFKNIIKKWDGNSCTCTICK